MKELTAEEARKIANNADFSYAQSVAYDNALSAIRYAAERGQTKIYFPDYSDIYPNPIPSHKGIANLAQRLEKLGYGCTCAATNKGSPYIVIFWDQT